jgi:predicted ATP-grasp superfamily ATP-dependent carboligase
VTRSVLITDGEQRSALAAVRSLGRSGYRVYVCSKSGRSIAGASRHALAEHAVSAPLANPSKFAHDVRALIDQWAIDVFLPMTEEAFNAIFAYPELFAGICIPSATAEQFRAVSDKRRVLEVAASCGLSVPAQVVLSTPDDAHRLSDAELRFPLVVKPARSVAQEGGKQLKLGAIHCGDARELRGALGALPHSAYPLLLQQRVIGPGVGVFLLLWDGEVVATFAHRRLREKPPAGGVSVYRESIAVEKSLLDRSRRLLERFGWRGVAMIEFKLDEATATPFIMEINGRFWGSLQLAIDAGVDFPALLVARANGERVFGPSTYKLGVRSRWEWGGVDYLVARLRHSNKSLSMPPGTPSRARAILSALLPWMPGDRLEVLRLLDPGPFLRETAQYFRRS